MIVTHQAEYKPELGQAKPLEKSDELVHWLSELPNGVVLSAINTDMGHQLDPVHVMVGLRADWQTEI